MDSIRRCDDCRRVIHGLAGNACPYCGGSCLNRLDEHRADGGRLHTPVFRLTLAFCFGLATMQVVALYIGLHSPPAGHGAPLWHLNLLVGMCVALYWTLRRGEGDFRALFFTALGIFVFGEALSALSRAYGVGALRGMSGVFRHALLVFSSLALTAGGTDTPAHSRHERTMTAACGGFLLLAVLHLMLEFARSENDTVEDAATALVAFGVAAYAGVVLYREKKQHDAAKNTGAPNAEHLLTPEKDDHR